MAHKKRQPRGEAHARERERREAGERRRAALPTPTGGPGHRRPQSDLGPDTVVFLATNFHSNDDGTWTVQAAPIGLGTMERGPIAAPPADYDLDPVTSSFPDLPAAWAGVHDLVNRFADQMGLDVAAIHALDGDRTAWAKLAAREGLTDQLPPDIAAGLVISSPDRERPDAGRDSSGQV